MTRLPRIGILGGTGWLGLALGQNLLRRGLLAPDHLTLLNRRGPTADYDDWPGVGWADSLATLARDSDVLILSLRPGDYACPAPQPFAGLVISFMTAIPLADLARDWPAARLGRAMPGGGASTGTGHIPWCAAPDLPPADIALTQTVLSAMGDADRVADETALAYMAALSGSGAAYPALMAQAMLDHALARGIPPDIAWRAVRSVVCDAPALLRDSAESAARLLDTYRGYRGVTAAGIETAAPGLTDALTRALDAATTRALTLRRDP